MMLLAVQLYDPLRDDICSCMICTQFSLTDISLKRPLVMSEHLQLIRMISAPSIARHAQMLMKPGVREPEKVYIVFYVC